ncbi:MAG: High potential iron-sulfur protein [Proteobacteria bacterium]|nr:MAG: High potential iron-sulfur protein [Pseudomonadota bacterium]
MKKHDQLDQSKRTFLRVGGLTLAALPFAGSLLSGLTSGSEAYAADLPACKETDPAPKALKYVSDAAKAKKPSPRAEATRKDQFCHNCQLYTKLSGSGDSEVGKCLVIPKCAVAHHGWCMSWVKKPGT